MVATDLAVTNQCHLTRYGFSNVLCDFGVDRVVSAEYSIFRARPTQIFHSLRLSNAITTLCDEYLLQATRHLLLQGPRFQGAWRPQYPSVGMHLISPIGMIPPSFSLVNHGR